MNKNIIGVDLAGAELPEEVLYSACQESNLQNLDLRFYTTTPFSQKCVVCSQVVKMQDDPSSFRHTPDATLIRALKDLSTGKIEALVTCANTGSLVVASSVTLGRFLKHPALAAIIPSKLYPNNLKNQSFSDAERPRFDSEKTGPLLDIEAVFSESKMGRSVKEKTNSSGCLGIYPNNLKNCDSSHYSGITPVLVLDSGAFVSAKASHLISHAFLGTALALKQFNIVQPRIGLLNIGKELKKGTSDLQKADTVLRSIATQEKHFFYVGYVEPFDVFSGKVDVLITSGFVGNIFLKTVEGILGIYCKQFSQTIKRGGALLAGVKKPLIKCHGKTSETSFVQAIYQAFDYASSHLVSRLEETFLNIEKDFIQKYGRNSS